MFTAFQQLQGRAELCFWVAAFIDRDRDTNLHQAATHSEAFENCNGAVQDKYTGLSIFLNNTVRPLGFWKKFQTEHSKRRYIWFTSPVCLSSMHFIINKLPVKETLPIFLTSFVSLQCGYCLQINKYMQMSMLSAPRDPTLIFQTRQCCSNMNQDSVTASFTSVRRNLFVFCLAVVRVRLWTLRIG